MAASSMAKPIPIRVAITTLDAHLADAFERAGAALVRDIPGLTITMHVAADFGSDLLAAERDIKSSGSLGDLVAHAAILLLARRGAARRR